MERAVHFELDILCLLILSFIVWQSVRNVNQQMRRIRFRTVVFGIMATLALDIFWMLLDGKVFPGAILLNRVVNALFLGAAVLMGSFWYLYVLETLGDRTDGEWKWVVLAPGILFMALNVLSIWTGWTFVISEKNVYVRGPLFWLQEVGAMSVLLISFFHILFRLFRNNSNVQKREIWKLLGFYVIPVVGTLLSMPYSGMPGTWTCAAVSIILIYLDNQDREILRDSLTGLNNRKALDNVFSEYSRISTPENCLHLFMMDLDDFKGINDRNGHPIGDQALMITAKLLLQSVQGVRSIVARYGGDEFLIMGFPKDDPEEIVRRIHQQFSEYNAGSDLPFQLTISAGFARYEAGEKLEKLIDRADMALYREKGKKRVL